MFLLSFATFVVTVQSNEAGKHHNNMYDVVYCPFCESDKLKSNYTTKIQLVSGCTIAVVGSSSVSNTKSITIDSRFRCPTTVDNTNWLDGEGIYSVAQVGNQITITRTDTHEYDLYDYDTEEWTTYGGGWDRNLKFKCCSGHGKFCSNTLFLHMLPMQKK